MMHLIGVVCGGLYVCVRYCVGEGWCVSEGLCVCVCGEGLCVMMVCVGLVWRLCVE